MSRAPASRHAIVLAAYALLALIFTGPLAAQFTRAIPGDGFDGLQNYWNLWWVRRALLDLQTTPFFSADLFYPTGTSLLYHTLNVLNGLWALPLQLMGGLVVAYNTVVVLTFVLSGYGAYLLALDGLRRIAPGNSASGSAAFIAGFIFAFAPFRMAHLLGHMQVLSTEWLPFFALAFLRMRDQPGPLRRRAVLPALFLILNALCDWYFVLYALLFAVLAVAWRYWRLWRDAERRVAPYRGEALALIAVVAWFALGIAPVLVPMLSEAAGAAYLRPPYEETILLSADLLAFVTPNEFHPLWGEAAREIAGRFTSSTAERTVFAGYTVLALAALGLKSARSRRFLFWALVALVFFLLALGPVLHVLGQPVSPLPMPYAWLYALVPLVSITRSVSRFDVMLMLALSQLAAAGLSVAPARRWTVLAGALIAFEFLAIPYPLWPIDTPNFYREIAREEGSFALLELPIAWDRPDPLVYQTVHARPLLTAYTSRSNPLSLVERTPVLGLLRTLAPDILVYDTREIGASVLSDLGVRYVVNHPLTMGAGEERDVTERVLRDLFGARPPHVNEPNLVAYRVDTPAVHRAYLVLGAGWGEVRQVQGKPQRDVTARASLRVMSKDAVPRVLRVTGRAAHTTAQVTVLGGARTVDAAIGADATVIAVPLAEGNELLILTSAPISLEALELRSR